MGIDEGKPLEFKAWYADGPKGVKHGWLYLGDDEVFIGQVDKAQSGHWQVELEKGIACTFPDLAASLESRSYLSAEEAIEFMKTGIAKAIRDLLTQFIT